MEIEFIYAWHDIAGNAGVIMVLMAYLWFQLGKMDPHGLYYSLLNGMGSLLIVVSLLFKFNLSAFLVEAAWVLISCIGIWRWLKGSNRGLTG